MIAHDDQTELLRQASNSQCCTRRWCKQPTRSSSEAMRLRDE
jgi:hypothetical protein